MTTNEKPEQRYPATSKLIEALSVKWKAADQDQKNRKGNINGGFTPETLFESCRYALTLTDWREAYIPDVGRDETSRASQQTGLLRTFQKPIVQPSDITYSLSLTPYTFDETAKQADEHLNAFLGLKNPEDFGVHTDNKMAECCGIWCCVYHTMIDVDVTKTTADGRDSYSASINHRLVGNTGGRYRPTIVGLGAFTEKPGQQEPFLRKLFAMLQGINRND